MLVKLVHPLNVHPLICVILSGKEIVSKPLQPLNAWKPMDSRVSGNVILVSFLHPAKAFTPILYSVCESVMADKLSQSLNTPGPIC
jgi:hypothetical protein